MVLPTLALLAAFQQPSSPTTPPSGDTVGYWQQRADYRIVARLDEARATLVARGELTYVNNSPDTLRELYLHQYLNAFRPASAWSRVDEREGRVRFQKLREPDHAFERFTMAPTVNGAAVLPEYPGSPDSTVVRLRLPAPLPPRDSLRVGLEWEARPSTVPRRQARRGRSYDFAHWYPKVAVYDRMGWRHQALVPAGEFYGEFGSFDVTLVLPEDQVVAATGVPVEGDPGWERVRRWGVVPSATRAYGAPPSNAFGADVPPGLRSVRFLAHGVHHFGWSVSPDYLYEGSMLVRREPRGPTSFTVFDSVPVHVLYRPGDEAQWGNGQAVARTMVALQWLEWLYGPYGYPQITNLHRIESGGTEFPMLMMNGSASQGLILHEGGHIYGYGMLANNEWRSGWMDEGLTSYQTDWAQGFALHERSRERAGKPRPSLPGYAGRARVPYADEAEQMEQYRLDLIGRAEPIGTPGPEFREYGVYTAMIYTRAKRMYGALRDAIGDSAFRAFHRDYYHRWAFKHVDEHAMRASAERASGEDLRWFFDQWVHRTGLIDYELAATESRRTGDGWLTRARVVRRGEYAHPMPVGARTSDGWTVVRAAPLPKEQWVEIVTPERPIQVRLDPFGTTEDWDGRNDAAPHGWLGGRPQRMLRVFDWPSLSHRDRERPVSAWFPMAWYSGPGGLTLGWREQVSYQGWQDRLQLTGAYAVRHPANSEIPETGFNGALGRVQSHLRLENPRLPFRHRPVAGLRLEGGLLDGVSMLRLDYARDESPFIFADRPLRELSLTLLTALVTDSAFPDPERWKNDLVEFGVGYRWAPRGPRGWQWRGYLGGGLATGSAGRGLRSAYPRLELEGRQVIPRGRRAEVRVRVFAGFSDGAPPQRTIRASSMDPVETYANHLVRPRDGALAHPDVHYVPTGGAGLRGYDPRVTAPRVVAVNVEVARRLATLGGGAGATQLWVSYFQDVSNTLQRGTRDRGEWPGEAVRGLSLATRTQLWDRPVRFRVDFPIDMDAPELGVGTYGRSGAADANRYLFRWALSFQDLW